MADTIMSIDHLSHGSVTYADGVIAAIAGLSTNEVEGIAGMMTGFAEKISKKSYTHGIKVEVEDNQVTVDVFVSVYYGELLTELSERVQDNVKKAIETMTGLEVLKVNIHIQDIKFKDE